MTLDRKNLLIWTRKCRAEKIMIVDKSINNKIQCFSIDPHEFIWIYWFGTYWLVCFWCVLPSRLANFVITQTTLQTRATEKNFQHYWFNLCQLACSFAIMLCTTSVYFLVYFRIWKLRTEQTKWETAIVRYNVSSEEWRTEAIETIDKQI